MKMTLNLKLYEDDLKLIVKISNDSDSGLRLQDVLDYYSLRCSLATNDVFFQRNAQWCPVYRYRHPIWFEYSPSNPVMFPLLSGALSVVHGIQNYL